MFQNIYMAYFNYHSKVKKLIREGNLEKVVFMESYNKIKPAMVLYFKTHRPMPIRVYRWQEYFELIENIEVFIDEQK